MIDQLALLINHQSQIINHKTLIADNNRLSLIANVNPTIRFSPQSIAQGSHPWAGVCRVFDAGREAILQQNI